MRTQPGQIRLAIQVDVQLADAALLPPFRLLVHDEQLYARLELYLIVLLAGHKLRRVDRGRGGRRVLAKSGRRKRLARSNSGLALVRLLSVLFLLGRSLGPRP